MKRTSLTPPAVLLSVALAAGCGRPSQALDEGYGEYVLVPAGEFLMGDNLDEGNSDEIPVHAVRLSDYYIARFKTTNRDYARFIDDDGYSDTRYWNAGGYGERGSEPDHWDNPEYRGGGVPGNDGYPVVGVSWFEAAAYCSWLGIKTGSAYRLPTEAEWEKAARGTDQRRYPWGQEIDESYANYDNGAAHGELTLSPAGYFDGNLHEAFQTSNNASPYGAYDMAGGTSEWCADWYDRSYYSVSPLVNPTGPASGTSRVLRGGGYVDAAYYQRAAGRHKLGAHFKSYKAGFRCVREMEGRG